MLRIRLRRTGARKKPSYRIVVAESTSPRDGKYIEIIGTYDPLTHPATVSLNGDRAKHWLDNGAQPSDRVVKLLSREGLVDAAKYGVTVGPPPAAEPEPATPAKRGKAAADETPAAEAAPVAEAAAEAPAADEPVTAEAEPAAGAATDDEASETAAAPAKKPRAPRKKPAEAAAEAPAEAE